MIFDRIFRTFGYVNKFDYEKLKNERNIFRNRLCQEEKKNDVLVAERAKANEDYNALQQKYERVESKNEYLNDEVWDLKSRLSDEVQKRFEIIELLAESEIVIKAGEGETKTLWHDAKENPPKNSRDVLIWSETGADVGYYGDTMGWIRKDGVIIDVKFWSEFSEPVVPKTVAKEVDNMVAD